MNKLDYLLIKENEWIIYDIMNKYSFYNSKEDLYQVGVIGIIKANKSYKEEYNTKFSTYAYLFVKGEILEYIRKDRNIKLSPDTLKIYKKYIQINELLTQKLSREPSLDEISLYINIDKKTLQDIINASEYELSLDKEINNDNINSFYEVIEDKKENVELKAEINYEIEKLSSIEKELINYRYLKDYTQSETAKLLNINQVQVSRYENKVLSKIRENMQ